MAAKKSLCLVEVHGGEKVERHYVSEPEFILGRGEDVAVQIPSAAASRHHFKIEVKDRSLWVLDLGSSNGTKVSAYDIEKNGKIIYAPGQPIRFGDKNLYVMIYLFQPPPEKHEITDDIVQDAVTNAEAQAQAERLQILANAKQEAQSLILQSEQQIRIARETAIQQIESEKSQAQAEISALRMQNSKEIIVKMEATQRQIDQTLSEGLKAADERATQLEKARRDTVEAEIQAVLEKTRQKGRLEIEQKLRDAQEKMQREVGEIRSNAQAEAEQTTAAARKSAAQLIKTFREKRVKINRKLSAEIISYQDSIQTLTQKRTEMEKLAQSATQTMTEAQKRRDQVTTELTGLEQEKSKKQKSFDLLKSELDRQIEDQKQLLHKLKNDHAFVAKELSKDESTVTALREQATKLEKASAELKQNSRSFNQAITDSQKELLQLEQKKRELEDQIEKSIAGMNERQRAAQETGIKKATREAARIIQNAKKEAALEIEKCALEVDQIRAAKESALDIELNQSQDKLLMRKAQYAKEFADQREVTITAICEEIERIFPGSKGPVSQPSFRSELSQNLASIFERLFIQSEIKSIASDRASAKRKRRNLMLRSLFSFRRVAAAAFLLFVSASLFYSHNTELPSMAASESYVDNLVRHPSFSRFMDDSLNRNSWKDQVRNFLMRDRHLSETDIERLVQIEDSLLTKLVDLKGQPNSASKGPDLQGMYDEERKSREQMNAILQNDNRVSEFKAFKLRYFSKIVGKGSQARKPAQAKPGIF